MSTKVFEFQAKTNQTIRFALKSRNSPSSPTTKDVTTKDGERLIGNLIEEKLINSVIHWAIEDIEGNIANINSMQFHKITDPKNFSKKFKFYKVQNHIVD